MTWLLLSNGLSEAGHLSILTRGCYKTPHTAVWPADRLSRKRRHVKIG